MQNIIKVNHPLVSADHEFELGAGLIVHLTKASSPLVAFLKEEFIKNPDVLSGDIRALLIWPKLSR